MPLSTQRLTFETFYRADEQPHLIAGALAGSICAGTDQVGIGLQERCALPAKKLRVVSAPSSGLAGCYPVCGKHGRKRSCHFDPCARLPLMNQDLSR